MVDRINKAYADEIIEFAGENVIGCTFLRCEFTGRANAVRQCAFHDCDPTIDAGVIRYCWFGNSIMPIVGRGVN